MNRHPFAVALVEPVPCVKCERPARVALALDGERRGNPPGSTELEPLCKGCAKALAEELRKATD